VVPLDCLECFRLGSSVLALVHGPLPLSVRLSSRR
jgi:hypothetical protein